MHFVYVFVIPPYKKAANERLPCYLEYKTIIILSS